MSEVLVLNSSYVPIRVVSWQRAVVLWWRKRVEIVHEYDDKWLHSWKITMRMPSVIRLLNFIRPPRQRTGYKKFCRRSIWERDSGMCQYCGHTVGLMDFTFDHVIPRARGGKRCFENIVCSCHDCNNRKSGKTPEEAGLRLLKKPVKPRMGNDRESLIIHFRIGKVKHKSWLDYIYWEIELEED